MWGTGRGRRRQGPKVYTDPEWSRHVFFQSDQDQTAPDFMFWVFSLAAWNMLLVMGAGNLRAARHPQLVPRVLLLVPLAGSMFQ